MLKLEVKRTSGATRINAGFALCFMAAVILTLSLSGCGGASGAEAGNHQLVPTVEAVQAQLGTLPLIERLTGVVRAENQIGVYPETSAAIVEVYVRDGENVRKGQPLVRLRDKDFQERLRQARADLKIAEAQLKQAGARLQETLAELRRAESLAKEQLISASELETFQTQAVTSEASLDLAKARVEQAQAGVAESEVELSETIIRSPVDGTVGSRRAEVGMMVTSSTRLFTLGRLDNLKIEIVLTDRMLNTIRVGQRTEILSDLFPMNGIGAPLSRISPFLNPVTHCTTAEIDLDNPDGMLKPGMFVTVDVFYGESEQATLVPLSALYENQASGATGVYLSRGDIGLEQPDSGPSDTTVTLTNPVSFDFVPVDVVARGRMHAGIRGVNPDDWVVTLGQNLLGSESGEARVKTVTWDWVEKLQHLQRQDLLEDIMSQQQKAAKKTPPGESR